MIHKYIIMAALTGLILTPALASAEMLTGTIQSVDPAKGQYTLMRSDTNENVTVIVKDRAELSKLETGKKITVEADKKPLGDYESAGAPLS